MNQEGCWSRGCVSYIDGETMYSNKVSDRYICLRRKRRESVSQSFENERVSLFYQSPVQYTRRVRIYTHHTRGNEHGSLYERKNARTTDPGCILSSPKLLRLANPGAFALIGTEHDLIVSHTLATTTTAASLIMVTPSELDVFPLLVSAGTSLDFVLDAASGAPDFYLCHCWGSIQGTGESTASGGV